MHKEIRVKDIDVLVIGGGLAAAFASIKAKEAGAEKVVQVCKASTGRSGNSAFAASVIHVCFPEDDLDDRVNRLSRSLAYIAQQDLIKDHLEESYDIFQDLVSYGCEFLRDERGNIVRLAARGAYPTVVFKGLGLMSAVRKEEKKRKVELADRVMITDLLTRDGQAAGAVGFSLDSGDFYIFESKATVLATGSTWYKGLLPGHRDDAGDGFAMAYRAGVLLGGGECNDQLSNLFPRCYDIGPGMNRWVGEGGIFINAKGERFMEKYNPRLRDRAGLSRLNIAFCMEAKRGNTPIYMDMRQIPPEGVRRLKEALIIPMKMFARAGLEAEDRITELIEWSPAAATARCGPVVNRMFETSMPGLYACGEAACTDAVVTGLASAATSGAKAGKSAAKFAKEIDWRKPDSGQVENLRQRAFAPLHRSEGTEPDQVLLSVQDAIIPYDVLFIRKEERMREALKKIEEIKENQVPLLLAYDPHYLRMAHEAESLLITAEIQLSASIFRKDSRIGIREDYPYEDNIEWLKFIRVRKDGNVLKIITEDVPIDTYPVKVERTKEIAYLWRAGINAGAVSIEGGEIKWV
ncbi:MAG: FAD-binding protein [Proteobacteria bacterium]|nr:FAD-binding protein [Pseudomonadota bacterium]